MDMDKVWFLYVEDIPGGRWALAHTEPTPHTIGMTVTGPFRDDVGELTVVVEHDPTPLILEAGGRQFELGGRVVLRRSGTMRTGRPCVRTGFYRSDCDHDVNMAIAEGEEMLQCYEGGGHDTVWVLVEPLP